MGAVSLIVMSIVCIYICMLSCCIGRNHANIENHELWRRKGINEQNLRKEEWHREREESRREGIESRRGIEREESRIEVIESIEREESKKGREGIESIEREERNKGECPTWTLPEINNSYLCSCGDSLKGIVRCNIDTLNVSIQNGYCMTHDVMRNTTYTGHCPYKRARYWNSNEYLGLPHNVSNLNLAMCGPLKRQGRLCGSCRTGYGPAVFSADLTCYHCSGPYHGWALYIFLELFPVTVFFLFIVLLQFRGTSSSINCFLITSQLAVANYIYFPPEGSFPFGASSNYLITTILVVYGFGNLDFFKPLVPPFCVSPHITGIYTNVLLYMATIHLLVLTTLAFILIELHAKDFKLIVTLWKPFHKYYVKVHRNINPHTSIIDAFSTVLILSYSRIMLASFTLLYPTPLYAPTGVIAKYVVSYEENVEYFSSRHVPFVLLAVLMLSIFNVLPAFFLIVYQCKCFQRLLGRWRKISQLVHPFADSFQGCYRSGADGKADYRYFAGLLMVFRVVNLASYVTLGSPQSWFLSSLICIATSLTFAHLRPYRNDRFNTIDSILYMVVTIILFSQCVVSTAGVAYTRFYQIIVQLGSLVPAVYIACFGLYRFVLTPMHRKLIVKKAVRNMNASSMRNPLLPMTVDQ